jgi:O-antigen/teichoic acid export membrane protein
VIARVLDIGDAGAFFLGFSILTVLWSVGSLGMPMALVRFLGGYSAQNKWIEISMVMSFAAKAVLVFSSVLGIIICFTSGSLESLFSFSESASFVIGIISIAIPIMAINNLIAFSFQGIHKTTISIYLQNISTPMLTSIILLCFGFFTNIINLSVVSYVFVFSSCVTLVTAFWFWLRQPGLSFCRKRSKNTAFLKSARFLYVSTIMGLFVQWSGIITLGIFVKDEEVALFSVAQRISMLTSFVLIAVNLVVAPRFAAIFSSGSLSELKEISIFCSRLMLLVATPVLIIMLLFPGVLLGLFGEQYRQAEFMLQIMVVGQFVNVVTGSVGNLLNMTGHEKDMRNILLITGILAVLLSFTLIPLYGPVGAAFATSIALASQNLFAVLLVKKRLGFNVLKIY